MSEKKGVLESRPKYRQIQERIRAGVADGSLTRGDKIPSEQDMAREFGVAYMTVRAAVNALVQEGVLRRIHGKGTFALPPADPNRALPALTLIVPSLPTLWNVAGLYYFPSIVQGFSAEATRLGFEPSVLGGTKEAFLSGLPASAPVAGVACLMVTRQDTEALEALRDQGAPVVGINAYPGRRAISRVAADQAGGMASAVRYLAAKGHCRIAFLSGPEGNLGAEERLRGFQEAIAAEGMEPLPIDDEGADYTDKSGAMRVKRLLAQCGGDPPTAILAAGDLIAAGALQALREANLRVPDDVSVMGFGDFHVAHHVQPALTTVRLPLFELGEQAVALLARHIAGASRSQTVTLPTEIIERETVEIRD